MKWHNLPAQPPCAYTISIKPSVNRSLGLLKYFSWSPKKVQDYQQTQGNARRVRNHNFDFENWTPVFRLAKRLVYCISLWVEKKLSERVLRGLMHATAELKRRIKGWILEQGGRKLHSKFRRQR